MPPGITYTEDNRKHLDFLQSIITRMNSNSFMIKGWAITIVSALLALAASTKEWLYLLITALPLITFWGLDAVYLLQERKFRSLYNKAIEDPASINTYDLNPAIASIEDDPRNTYWNVLLSKTVAPLYFSIAVIAVLCMLFIKTKPSEINGAAKVIVHIQDTIQVRTLK